MLTDANSNTANSVYTSITVNPLLTVSAQQSSGKTIDVGQSLPVNALATGGTGSYTYSWTSTCTGYSSGSGNTVTFTPTAAGSCAFTFTSNDIYTSNTATTATITVNPLLTVTAKPSSPATIEVGQNIPVNALATGGTGSYTYSWISSSCPGAAGSGSGNTLTYTPVSATSCTFTFTANDIYTSNTATTSTITVNPPPLASISPASNVIADQGQYESFNGVITGGLGSYNVFLYVSNTANHGIVVYSTNSLFAGPAWSFNGIQIPGNWATNSPMDANVMLTDADSVAANSAYTSDFIVNPSLLSTSWTASNTFIGYGQYEVLNAIIQGGTMGSGYTYNFLVYNSIGSLVDSALHSGVQATSNSFIFQQNSLWGANTFTANIIVTDTASTQNTVTNTLQYTAEVSLCTISLSNTLIAFGGGSGIGSGTSSGIVNSILDTNGGNINAALWTYGGNWIGPQPTDNGNFFVANTLWSSTFNGLGTPLQLPTGANTAIILPATSSNSIYFGVNVPTGASTGTFSQTITITNIC